MDTANLFDETVVHIPPVGHIPAGPGDNPPVVNGVAGNTPLVNLGWEKRRSIAAESHAFEFEIPLVHDFFMTKRLLIPGVTFTLEANRTGHDFALVYSGLAANQFKVKIEKLQLRIRKVTLRDDLAAQHRTLFANRDCPYYHTATASKQFNLVAGSTIYHMANLFSGRLPTQVMIGLLEQGAFQGNHKKNPFNFVNAGLNRINISINGRSIPAVAYTPDYGDDNNLFTREYQALMDNSGW